MTTENRMTREEEAYRRLLDKEWETLSEAARSIIDEAGLAAYKGSLVYTLGGLQPDEYEEAIKKMFLAATELAGREREILAELVRAANTAADSIDPEDRTPVGHKVDRGDVHRYYNMVAVMIEEGLRDETFSVRIEQHDGHV